MKARLHCWLTNNVVVVKLRVEVVLGNTSAELSYPQNRGDSPSSGESSLDSGLVRQPFYLMTAEQYVRLCCDKHI